MERLEKESWGAYVDTTVPKSWLPYERLRARLGYSLRSNYRTILRVLAIIALARIATIIVGVIVVQSPDPTTELGNALLVVAAIFGVLFAGLAGLTALLGSVKLIPSWLAVTLTVFAFALMAGEAILTMFGMPFSHMSWWVMAPWLLSSIIWWGFSMALMLLVPTLRLAKAVDSSVAGSKAAG